MSPPSGDSIFRGREISFVHPILAYKTVTFNFGDGELAFLSFE
jgi:hypothetical protein